MDTPQPALRTPYKALSLVASAYILAILAAIGTGYIFRGMHPLWMLLLADIAGTLVIYISGRFFHNASFYDPYWSVAPLIIAIFWIFIYPQSDAVILRQVIVATLVFAWGLRLTYNWGRGWQGLKHEDWRYRNFRNTTGKWFWLVELVGIELMPTVFVFLGCLSLYPALAAGKNPFGTLDVFAIIITAGAILIEATADEQLRSFARKKTQPGEIMAEGLWAYCRHPNYLGEVSFWWGLFFFGLAANGGYWWTVAGPLAITALFIFISVPMMDKRNMARRPGYGQHKKDIPALIPRLHRTH